MNKVEGSQAALVRLARDRKASILPPCSRVLLVSLTTAIQSCSNEKSKLVPLWVEASVAFAHTDILSSSHFFSGEVWRCNDRSPHRFKSCLLLNRQRGNVYRHNDAQLQSHVLATDTSWEIMSVTQISTVKFQAGSEVLA
ncbi:hypothetical protein BST61_g11356 [Cercospora zeina]